MALVKNLLGNSGVYIGSGILNASIPFLLLPILTRYLTPSEYGILAVFNVWMSFTFVICTLNVHSSANREFFEKGHKQLAVFISNCLIIVFFASLVFFSLVYFSREKIGGFLNIPEELLLLGIILSICNVFIQIRLGQWQVRERPFYFGGFIIGQSIVNMLLSLFFIVVIGEGLRGRIIGIALPIIIFSIIALFFLNKEKLIKFSFKKKYIIESLKFSIPLVPHTLGAFMLLSIDRAIISSKLGVEAAGLYMVAFQCALVMSLILDAVNKAFSPWLYKLLKEDSFAAKQLIVKVTYGLFFIIFIGIICAFLFSEFLIKQIIGDEFIKAASIVPFLISAQGIRGGYLFVTNYLFYAKKTYLLSIITIFTGALNIVLVISFLDMFGIIGAAYSLTITMTIQWLLTWWLANKVIKMPWFFQVK